MHDYFTGCTTTTEIKDRYRELARANHPDLGGDTRTMQDINAAYDAACLRAQRQERPDKSESAYAWYAAGDRAVAEAVSRIITLPGIEIEITGWWVWVSGDTKAVKDALKAAGYKWASGKGMWYFPGVKSSGKGNVGMDAIRARYGSQRVASQPLDGIARDD